MTDSPTLRYYEANADTFFDQTVDVDMSPLYARFLGHVPLGAHIVDAGCGSGRDAKAFMARGYQVTAFDASAALAERASALLGIPVPCRSFADITEVDVYDGVWACASLLHVPQHELLGTLQALSAALRRGGTLYASFKEGTAERSDLTGRHFTDMTAERLHALFAGVPQLALVERWSTSDRRGDRPEQIWWNVLARKL
ncbi:MAG: class I SAM-dependent methyltransferase [Pseudomonadota bacterium]